MDHDVAMIELVLEQHIKELEGVLEKLRKRLEVVKRERQKHKS